MNRVSHMKAKEFKYTAQAFYVDKLRSFIDLHMEHDGNTSETSQRICILNHISALEQAINGVEKKDLKKD